MFKFGLGQHCAFAFFCAAAASVFSSERVCQWLVTHQPVVERELFAAPHLTSCLDEHAPLHVNRLAVGLARVVDPARVIAAMKTINHARVVDVEVKRVLGIARVVRVTTQRLGHGNDLAHVFDDGFARCHGAQGEYAFAVDLGLIHRQL